MFRKIFRFKVKFVLCEHQVNQKEDFPVTLTEVES